MVRGGSFTLNRQSVRAAYRYGDTPNSRSPVIMFQVVVEAVTDREGHELWGSRRRGYCTAGLASGSSRCTEWRS